MQKRLKCRHETRNAKLEILNNTWDKLLGSIHENNLKVSSSFAYSLVVQIGKVDHKVKMHALEEFLRCA
jgi:hypothetical protein